MKRGETFIALLVLAVFVSLVVYTARLKRVSGGREPFCRCMNCNCNKP